MELDIILILLACLFLMIVIPALIVMWLYARDRRQNNIPSCVIIHY